jgi:hypothetical protein
VRLGRVLEQPVGRMLPWAGTALAKVLGRLVDRPARTPLDSPLGSVGTVVVRPVGRVLGRTRPDTVLERLVVARATVQARPGRTRVGLLVRMAVASEVMGELGLLGLWFWWWPRWLLPG